MGEKKLENVKLLPFMTTNRIRLFITLVLEILATFFLENLKLCDNVMYTDESFLLS